MKVEPTVLKRYFQSIGMTHLYHANTVTTSITFIEQCGLLSREYVEKNGLKQTEQYTDGTDKYFNIWNDIFFDTCDIHERASNINQYGPVLFKLSLSILEAPNIVDINITRSNPCDWQDGMTENDRYFGNIDEIKQLFNQYTFKQMVTIKTTDGRLTFEPYLEGIILDDPGRQIPFDKTQYFNLYDAALASLTSRASSSINFLKRDCSEFCSCHAEYSTMSVQKLRGKFCLQLIPNNPKFENC